VKAKLCGVEQMALPMFGRATITLGIGPHFLVEIFIVGSDWELTVVVQASGFPDALEDAHLLSWPDGVAKVLAVLASALQSSTNPASRTHLLNTVRTSPLMTQHLSAFFTLMPAERLQQRQRIFRRAIKVRKYLSD